MLSMFLPILIGMGLALCGVMMLRNHAEIAKDYGPPVDWRDQSFHIANWAIGWLCILVGFLSSGEAAVSNLWIALIGMIPPGPG